MKRDTKPLIIAITGASGAIYGIRLLEACKDLGVYTHLLISKAAHITIKHETTYSLSDIKALAGEVHSVDDIAACISSGSYKTAAMIIAPCSMKTMSEIASGVTPNLISRSADVVLKERRKLVLMVRETPFHLGHLESMTKLTQMGAIIAPALPAFYIQPNSIDDLINHSIGRVLDLVDIDHDDIKRWQGL